MGAMLDRTRTTMPIDQTRHAVAAAGRRLLAFVLSVNKFPAGEFELPRQAEC